jgi:hypothetical protein
MELSMADAARPPIGILRCHRCEKILECTTEALQRYVPNNWPECCGEVMTYFAATEKPSKLPEGKIAAVDPSEEPTKEYPALKKPSPKRGKT